MEAKKGKGARVGVKKEQRKREKGKKIRVKGEM